MFALLSKKWWRNFCLKARSGKRVWVLEVWSENGCGKWHVLVWNRVRIWRTGRHTPPRIARSTPLLGREYSHGSLVDLSKLVVFFEQRESAFPVGSDFFTTHKMFHKKKKKKTAIFFFVLIELAIFPPFPLAYSSDIANVSTGVRLESWKRSGGERTLPTPFPPPTIFLFRSRSNFRTLCNKSSGKACYGDYFASNGDLISQIPSKKKSFRSWKIQYPVWAAIKIESLFPCLRLEAPKTILIQPAVPRRECPLLRDPLMRLAKAEYQAFRGLQD